MDSDAKPVKAEPEYTPAQEAVAPHFADSGSRRLKPGRQKHAGRLVKSSILVSKLEDEEADLHNERFSHDGDRVLI